MSDDGRKNLWKSADFSVPICGKKFLGQLFGSGETGDGRWETGDGRWETEVRSPMPDVGCQAERLPVR
ncbi:hypothetical protein [Algoriphagus mannitolivorans]|uniref:hypothetical protein n=1 Tax=Algoriphagus mannitolivorans TaxID=226504 RepID=UPI00047CDA48|nr:hypothetical protein [Algoriphagus mannitolivorans]